MANSESDVLIQHLVETTTLDAVAANRLVQEVKAFYSETLPQFVSRRHRELRQQGVQNERIYQQLLIEVADNRFVEPELSVRQIRRLIYG